MPNGQRLQLSIEPWNGMSRYVSGGHGVQALLPTDAYVPNWHEMQVWPAPKEIVPLSHAEHVSAPSVFVKKPGSHQSHLSRRANTLEAVPGKQG